MSNSGAGEAFKRLPIEIIAPLVALIFSAYAYANLYDKINPTPLPNEALLSPNTFLQIAPFLLLLAVMGFCAIKLIYELEEFSSRKKKLKIQTPKEMKKS